MPAILSATTLHAVLQLVDRLYAADNSEQFARTVVAAVAGLVPSDSVDVTVVTRRPVTVRVVDHPAGALAGAAETLAAALEGLRRAHPHEVFRLLFADQGGAHQRVTALRVDEQVVAGVRINRRADRFGARDDAVIAALRPHLRRAYRVLSIRDELGWQVVPAQRAGAQAPATAFVDERDPVEPPTGAAEGPPLTTREREVLTRVAAGLTDAQVAADLVISPRTVQKHLENAYRKLGVANRTAATRIVT